MRKYKIVSLESGLILGELLESVIIMGQREYVAQWGSKRFFVKATQSIILRK